MKATKVRIEAKKYIGNFQTVLYSVEYEVHDEDVQYVFAEAKRQIELAHEANYATVKADEGKQTLTIASPEFQEVKKAVLNGKSIKEISKYYDFDIDALKELEELV